MRHVRVEAQLVNTSHDPGCEKLDQKFHELREVFDVDGERSE